MFYDGLVHVDSWRLAVSEQVIAASDGLIEKINAEAARKMPTRHERCPHLLAFRVRANCTMGFEVSGKQN